MDILSHMALGATCTHLGFHHKFKNKSLYLGALAGALPNIDLLWLWPTTPVYNLLVHRSVTHSLILWPMISALLAWAIFKYFKKKQDPQSFYWIWGACALAYFVHLLFDYLTSYGTALFWPISSRRFYADLLPMMDSLFLTPLIVCGGYALFKKSIRFHWGSLIWVSFYLFIMFLQKQTVLQEQEKLILARGQEPLLKRAIPTNGNIFVWRSLYRTRTHAFVDQVTTFPLILPRVEQGESALLARPEAISSTYLNTELIQKNFSYFYTYADGFVAFKSNADLQKQVLQDLRFSRSPKGMEGRVQIEFDRFQATRPVKILSFH